MVPACLSSMVCYVAIIGLCTVHILCKVLQKIKSLKMLNSFESITIILMSRWEQSTFEVLAHGVLCHSPSYLILCPVIQVSLYLVIVSYLSFLYCFSGYDHCLHAKSSRGVSIALD